MRAIWMVLAAIATPALVSAQEKETDLTLMPSAPVAEQRLHETMLHGTTLSDPWHWLRDTSYPLVDDPDVLAYVKAEHAWFEAARKPHEALVETMFQVSKGRIKEEDAGGPQQEGAFDYWDE